MITCEGCPAVLPDRAGRGRPRRWCSDACRVRAARRRAAHPRAEWADDRAALYVGDARTVLPTLATGSVHAVVTSPPYLGQRRYGPGSAPIGAEPTVSAYLDALVAVFDEVARVLHPTGTVWINVADRYSGTANAGPSAHRSARRDRAPVLPARVGTTDVAPRGGLLHLPARLAIALGDRGWLTRNVVTWHKPNGQPHPTTARLATRTETVLVLARATGHFFDRSALDEPGDVWTIPTRPGDGSHPAVMPLELARRAVVAGCPPDGVVLDPFAGVATSGFVALAEGRRFVGIELHRPYADVAAARLGLRPAVSTEPPMGRFT